MKPTILAAALLLPALPALAQTPGIEGVVDALAAQGYTGIEIGRPQGGTIKVEAHRQGAERELVYDARSGRILSDRTEPATRAGGATGHADDRDTSARGTSHDAGDDHGGGTGSSHDGGDDRGSGGGSSHDGGDDHGGSAGNTSHGSGGDHRDD